MNNTYSFNYDVYDVHKDETTGKYTKTYVKTDKYAFRSFPRLNLIMIEKNGEKHSYKVKDDSNWTVSVQKTQIKAKGGSDGLSDFFKLAITDASFWGWKVVKIIDGILEKTKEAF